ncbi:hypothetical protein ACPF3S_003144 [Vibrio cholerae]|uniref:Uncharacterized protein n=2 Tax=Vibrio cholerae TaxID=666 RepID=A0A7Z7VNV3_VIBCL|nr:hypothetical protein [Vibrio cholerae]EGQ7707423.1 hypothetical protein [Vibrio cholerae]EGR5063459.1 hypothetical protein [Vibrio cholerae]EII3728610.1 hypothetical protein [Vibrio cholerae]EKF9501206.1 hypothetical protein [Vibrio cholerae]ELH0870583.1 hypothetical protein [Vibrio cholerae]
MKTNVILFVFLLLLAGCSISDNLKGQQAAVDLQKERMDNVKKKENEFNRITLDTRFYVSDLNDEAMNMPSWYSNKIEPKKYNSVPFKNIIQDVLTNNHVSVNYGDLGAAELDAPVTISTNETSLGQYLRQVANQAGLSLTYSRGRAVFSKFERRSWDIMALDGVGNGVIGRDGSTTTSTSTTSLSSTSTSMTASTSGQFSNIKITDQKPLEDLQNLVKGVLSAEGEVTISATGSIITVKDYPYNVEEADKIIREFNDQSSKVVSVELSLIDVIYTKTDRLGFDINGVISALGDGVEITSTGPFTSAGAGTVSPMQFSLKFLDGRLDGSKALAEALNAQGAVSRTVFQKVVTKNGTIGRTSAVKRESYIAEQTGNGATTGGIITNGGTRQETLETGQVVSVYPRIVNDDVLVKINSSISTSLGITPKLNETTGTYVESPKVADMEFDQTLVIPDRQTYVIAGIQADQVITEMKNAGYDVTGFSKSGDTETKDTLLTVTVEILRGKTVRRVNE